MRQAILIMFVCGWLSVVVQPAAAQVPSLPTGITATQTPFTPEQRDAATAFWRYWSEQMTTATNDQQIATARQTLARPLSQPGVTEVFREQYASIGISQLADVLADDAPMTRMNGLIVLAALRQPAGLELALNHLQDEHVGVRYWAGSAASQSLLGDRLAATPLNAEQREAARQALGAALQDEKQGPVRGTMYVALERLNTNQARKTLLDALDARLAHYMTNGVTMGLEAEVDAFEQLRVALSATRIKSDEVKKHLITVAARYLQLAKHAVETDQINDHTYLPLRNLVTYAELILGRGVGDFDPSGPRPPLAEPFKAREFTKFRLNVTDWVTLLTQLKTQIPREDLQLPAAGN
jgi:hypothetical protein